MTENAADFKTKRDDVFGRIASKYDLLCDLFSFGIHRVLKPSGKLVVLEASNIPVKIIHRLYLKYMALVMPIIGWLERALGARLTIDTNAAISPETTPRRSAYPSVGGEWFRSTAEHCPAADGFIDFFHQKFLPTVSCG